MKSDRKAVKAALAGLPQRKVSAGSYLKRYWQLYLLLLIPMAYFIIFKYVPMQYIQIAFKEYKIGVTPWQMPWTAAKEGQYAEGMKYFYKIFNNPAFWTAVKNTLVLNLLDLILSFPAPIIFAIVLNELRFPGVKKATQTIAYMPHFLSWIIIYSLSTALFADKDGMINNVLGTQIPFLSTETSWTITYVMIGVWQSFGWGSIIYLAAIAGINPELYEAASVDGAGRFQKIWHVTLPGIRSTIVVLLIMNLGNILGSGFDRPYAFQNNLVMGVAEVISTYVYKYGIKALQFSMTTAVGLFQSVICLFFLLGSNWLSKKLGERGIF